jgi:hypothetical protein
LCQALDALASLSAITANRSPNWASSPRPAALRAGFDEGFLAAGFLAASFLAVGLEVFFMDGVPYGQTARRTGPSCI